MLRIGQVRYALGLHSWREKGGSIITSDHYQQQVLARVNKPVINRQAIAYPHKSIRLITNELPNGVNH